MSDITYCTADCERIGCERHHSHINSKWLMVSLADFSEDCRCYRPIGECPNFEPKEKDENATDE